MGAIPPLRYISKGYCAIGGGISHWAAKCTYGFQGSLNQSPLQIQLFVLLARIKLQEITSRSDFESLLTMTVTGTKCFQFEM